MYFPLYEYVTEVCGGTMTWREIRRLVWWSMEGSRWVVYLLLIHLFVSFSFVLVRWATERISEHQQSVQIPREISFYRRPCAIHNQQIFIFHTPFTVIYCINCSSGKYGGVKRTVLEVQLGVAVYYSLTGGKGSFLKRPRQHGTKENGVCLTISFYKRPESYSSFRSYIEVSMTRYSSNLDYRPYYVTRFRYH